MAPPAFDEHLGFSEGCEQFHVQDLVSELRVKAFAIAVLPWTSGFDVERLDADAAKPRAQVLCNELWSIVRTDVFGWTVFGEEVGEAMQDIVGPQPALDHDSQGPARKLINHCEHAERPPVIRTVLDEVVRPDMVGVTRPQADARSIA